MHKRDIHWWAALAGIIAAVLTCCGVLVAIGNWLFPFSPRPWAQATPAQTESVSPTDTPAPPTDTPTPAPSIDTPSPSRGDLGTPVGGVEPSFSNLFFAAGVSRAGEPVGVATEFPSKTTIVYSFASYGGMSDGAQCESVWYLDGEETLRNAFDWALGESGTTWIANVYDDSELKSGRYDWELYVEGKLVVTGGFVVR